MFVVETMAGDARPGEIFVPLPRMACRASDLGVRADEGKFRLAVVERFNLAPDLFAVATVTLFAQPTLVGIIGLVTIKAASRGFAVFHVRGMATVAACSLVRPLQCEVGERMVEGFAIELNDIEWATLVVGVANPALRLGCFGVVAMETAPALPIRGDRLVACQAQPSL